MNKARVAVGLAFISNGLGSGTIVSRIPDYKKLIALSNAQFGFALLAGTAGVLLALGPAGRLAARFGSRNVAIIASLFASGSLVGVGAVRNAFEFVIALFAWGLCGATMDVAMNAHAIAIEQHYETKFMGRFHGMWSLGAFGGAFVGGLFSQKNWGTLPNMILIGLFVASATLVFQNWWLPSSVDTHQFEHEKRRRTPPRIFWILGLIGFCGAVCEGAASDWGGILSRNAFNATPFVSTLPYVLFCVAMVSGRFSGDYLAMKFAARNILITTGLIAGVGLGGGILVGSIYGVILGWFSLGLGVSIVIPTLFSMSGKLAKEKFQTQIAPSEAVSMVSGITYSGFMAGPPMIGLLSNQISLRWAMLLPAILALSYAYISSKVLD
jgi:MFS family permease